MNDFFNSPIATYFSRFAFGCDRISETGPTRRSLN